MFAPTWTGESLPSGRKATLSFFDRETDSVCNILGEASGGPLAREKLTPIIHANNFWFSWGPFKTRGQAKPRIMY